MSNTPISYEQAGVSIDAGNALVEDIKPFVQQTLQRSGTLSSIGGFGGLFDVTAAGYKDPILVAATDGVGTKLKIAIDTNRHSTIGQDLVAMCVNDLLAMGAEPLFFLDYFATSELDVTTTAEVVKGIANACKDCNVALIGGETAELPGMYHPKDYDLAGFCVGAMERETIFPSKNIQAGDHVIGLASSGIHSNGYSLVRKIVQMNGYEWDDIAPFGDGIKTMVDYLLAPTTLYVSSTLPAIKDDKIKAFANITGGGITENLPRVLPDNMAAHIDLSSWVLPPLFAWLAQNGPVEAIEMLRTLNCGIGATVIASSENVDAVISHYESFGIKAYDIGVLKAKTDEEVIYQGLDQFLPAVDLVELPSANKKNVAILISGRGSNMLSLVKAMQAASFPAQCCVVISDKKDAAGLELAEQQGIKTVLVDRSEFNSKAEFEAQMQKELAAHEAEYICAAGFFQVLSAEFCDAWSGKIINIHPSLLPAFKGLNTHQRAIDLGVQYSGASVHHITAKIDDGPIVMQKIVPVRKEDTADDLAARILKEEHALYPQALKKLILSQD